jgi:hypothetical protein
MTTSLGFLGAVCYYGRSQVQLRRSAWVQGTCPGRGAPRMSTCLSSADSIRNTQAGSLLVDARQNTAGLTLSGTAVAEALCATARRRHFTITRRFKIKAL